MNTKMSAVLAVASLFFASLASGAAYMKFDGVDGEAKDKDHKGWIDILSVSGLAETRDASSGMATGKRQHKPITITKAIDKSTPALAKAGWKANGPALPKVLRISDGGVTYELTGVQVVSVKQEGDKEVYTLSYGGIKASHDAAMSSVRNVKAAEAQDHNSSRSNKSAAAQEAPVNNNSSRSNR